jgi:hypothetical protein
MNPRALDWAVLCFGAFSFGVLGWRGHWLTAVSVACFMALQLRGIVRRQRAEP